MKTKSQIHLKSRPILFTGAMVNAIMSGNKTETRRIIKTPNRAVELMNLSDNKPFNPKTAPKRIIDSLEEWELNGIAGDKTGEYAVFQKEDYIIEIKLPNRYVGSTLWVRETHKPMFLPNPVVSYRADGEIRHIDQNNLKWFHEKFKNTDEDKWRPSLFMEEKLSRLNLLIKDVKVERLQDITESGALKEGIKTFFRMNRKGALYEYDGCSQLFTTAVSAYKHLWEKINGKGSWAVNPWVEVIKFERING